MPANEKLLTVQEAAQFLGVSTKTLRRWDQNGRLVPERTVGNQRRYTLSELETFKSKSDIASLNSAAIDANHTLTESGSAQNPNSSIAHTRLHIPEDSYANLLQQSSKNPTNPAIVQSELDVVNSVDAKAEKQMVTEEFDEEVAVNLDPNSGKKSNHFRMIVAGIAGIILLLLLGTAGVAQLQQLANGKGNILTFVFPQAGKDASTKTVKLAQSPKQATAANPALELGINIPAVFGQKVTFLDSVEIKKALVVEGRANLNGGIITNNADIDAGTGKVTAANLVYSLVAGSNISISGDPQNPTISAQVNGGVTSLQGQTGALALSQGSGIGLNGLQITNTGVLSLGGQTGNVSLAGGSGISVSGTTINNTDPGSAQNIFKSIIAGSTTIDANSNNDSLSFAAGSGITITGDAGNKTITITGSGNGLSSLTPNGVLYATSTTTATSTTPGTNGTVLKGVTGGAPVFAAIDLSTDVSGILPLHNGGTGISSTPTNGQLLIGNGSGYTLGTVTAGTGISITNGSGSINVTNNGVLSVTGTANQVIASGSTGAIMLSLPQDIASNSNPSFAALTLTSNTNQLTLGTGNTGVVTLGTLTTGRTYMLPDASGTICLTSGNCSGAGGGIVGTGTSNYVPKFTGSGTIGDSAIYDSGGKIGIGTTSPQGLFSVVGAAVGQALVSLNETGNQNILTGSASGTTRFVFDRAGNLNLLGGAYQSNGISGLSQGTPSCVTTTNGIVTGFGTCQLGSEQWVVSNGAISTGNLSLDLLLGGNSTASAKFAVTNISGGTPTASISANSGNNATYLSGDGTLGTTNKQSLTIGSNSTGNIVLNGFTAGIVKANSSGVLSSSAVDLASSDVTGTLPVNRGGTGATTFTSNGVLYGNGSGNLQATSPGADGQLLLGNTSGAPAFVSLSGDATLANTGVITLKNTGTAGTYGSASQVPVFTTDAQGRITSVTNTPISIAASQITSGLLGSNRGGTGADLSGATQGSIAYFSSTGVMSALAPSTAGYVLTTNGAGQNPTWTNAASLGTNYWQRNAGTLSPLTITDDLLVGGAATSSALFSISGTTGNASTSGSVTFTTAGNIQTTASQTLTLGGATTGNITLAPQNGNGTTLNTGNFNLASGKAYQINGTNVLTSTTLGSGVTASSLTSVGALNSGSIASGFGTISTSNTITGTTLNGTTGINTGAGAGTQRIDASGNLANIGTINASGALTFGNYTTNGGLLYTNGSGVVQQASAGSSGQLLVANSSGIPTFVSMSGDATLAANGVLTISPDSVALGTDTTGNYVASLTSGNGISASATGEGSTPTISLGALSANWNQTGAYDIVLNNANSQLKILESAGNTYFGSIDVGDLTGDQTYTFPDLSGTVCLSSGNCAGGAGGSKWQKNGTVLAPLSATDQVVLGGNTTTPFQFEVNGSRVGKALASLNETGDQNILTASTSGVTKFNLANNGNVQFAGNTSFINTLTSLATANRTYTLPDASGTVCLTTGNCAGAGGGLTGSGTAGQVAFFNSSGTLTSETTGFAWDASNKRLGIGTDTPTSALDVAGNASISGALTFRSGAGSIQTSANNTLIIGGATTGNITLAPLNGSGTVTSTGNFNLATGKAYQINGTNVLTATTLGSGVTASSLTSVGALNSGSIASGFGTIATTNTITGTTLNGTTGINTGAGAGTQRIDASGNLTNIGTINASGALTFGNYTTNGGLLYTNGSGVVGQTSTGTSGQVLQSNGGGAPTWVDSASLGTNYWQRNNGALSPLNITDDLLVGGTSTGSAKFQIFGNTGNATTSGSLTFNTAGSIQTTNRQTLVMGGTTTGDIQFKPGNATNSLYLSSNGNVGIGLSNPISPLHVRVGTDQNFRIGTYGGNAALASYNDANNAFTGLRLYGSNILLNSDIGGSVGIGTTAPLAGLDVRTPPGAANAGTIPVASISGQTAKAAFVVDNTGLGDIFTASKSGASKFSVLNNGNVQINNLGTGVVQANASGVLSSAALNLAGGANYITGTLSVGNGGTGATSVGSAGSVAYSNGSTYAFTGVGTSGQVLQSNGSGTPTWVDAAGLGTNYWQRNAGSLSPLNITDDLLVGGTSTGSALFRVSGTTGDVTASGNVSLASGKAYQINGTSVLTATTLGSSVTASSLTSVGALNSGSIASGFGTIVTANTITGTTLNGTTGINTGAGAGTQRIDASGNLANIGTINASGALTFGNYTTNGGLLYTNGSGVVAQTSTGTSGQVLQSNGGGAPTWVNAASLGTNYWQRNNGALSPLNITDDVLFGGTSTSSAKFAFLNNAAGTPTASISGSTAGNALSLSGDGTIATSLNRSLILNPNGGNVGIGTNVPAANLVVQQLSGQASDIFQVKDSGGNVDLGVSNLGNAYIGTSAIGGRLGISTGASGSRGLVLRGVGAQSADLFQLQNVSGTILSNFNANGQLTIQATGGTTPNASISGQTANASLIVDNSGVGDLFTASKSGASKFSVLNNGNVQINNLGTGVVQANASGILSSAALNLAGGASYLTGTLPVGNGGTGATSVGSAGSVAYSNGSTYAFTGVGTSGQVLQSNGSGAPTWVDAAGLGTNYWQRNNGALSPLNITDDLLVGGSATSSAKFQIFGNTGNATTSGSLTFNTASSIQTTANQTLTLGGATTGNISLTPQNGNGSVAVNGNLNLATGKSLFAVGSTASDNLINAQVTGDTNQRFSVGADGTLKFGPGNTATDYTINRTTSTNLAFSGGASFGNVVNVATGGTSYGARLNINSAATGIIGLAVRGAAGQTADLFQLQNNGGTVLSKFDANGALTINSLAGTLPAASISGATSFAGAVVDQSGLGDIFTASKSGASKFSVLNNGNVQINNLGTGVVQANASGVLSSAALNLAGGTSYITGTLPVANGGTGATSVGSAGSVAYSNGSTYAFTGVGTSGQVLQSNGSGTPTWVDSSTLGTNYWQRNNGTLSPLNITDDLLVGGTSTASAKFQIFGNTGNATTSGSLTFNTAGSIQTTNRQTLTLGGATTGNIVLNPQNGSGFVTLNGNLFDVASVQRITANSGQAFKVQNSSGTINALVADTTNGRLGVNTTSMLAALDVRGNTGTIPTASFSGATSFAGTVVDQSGLGDLFTASKSGATKFSILNNGKLSFAGTSSVLSTLDSAATSSRAYVLPDSSGTICLVEAGNCAGSGSGVTTAGGTTNRSVKFTGSQAVGNGSINDLYNGVALTIDASGNLGVGQTNPIARLQVDGGNTGGNAAFLVNQTGATSNDIFSASASGVTKFTLANNGNLQFAGNTSFINTLTSLATANRTYTLPDATGTICLNTGNCAGSGGGLTGSGTAGQVAFFNGSGTLTSETSGFAWNTTTKRLGIGNNTPVGMLDVSGANVGKALTILNESGDQNILTGSASGTTRFTFDRTGNLNLNGGGYQISGTNVLTSTTLGSGVTASSLTSVGALNSGSIASGFGTISTGNTITGTTLNGTTGINTGAGAGTQRIDANGNLANIGTINASGALTFSNYATNGGLLYTNGSGVVGQTSTGTSGQVLQSNGGGAPTWVDSASLGTNYWQRNAGTLSPLNITDDLLIGGTSTASAKFQIFGNTGNATTSGSLTFNTAGTIQTTNKQTLNIGSANTGNIILTGGNVGIGTTTPGAALDVSGTQRLLVNSTQALKIQNSGGTIVPLLVDTTNGRVGVNITGATALGALDVRVSNGTLPSASISGQTAFAGLVVDQSGLGDLFTASKSGASKFTVLNNGSVQINNLGTGVVQANGSGILSSSALDLSNTSLITNTLGVANGGTGATSVGSAGSVAYSNGSTYAFTGVGTSGQVLQSNGSGTPTWVNAASLGTNYWQRNAGTLSPLNITDDLLVGGTSTASAKFQIFGNTGNATTSGSLTFNAAGSIQTTANQTLTLGGASTGNIVFSPQNGTGAVLVNGNLNLASGNAYQINGTNVLTATTLGSGVTASSLTSVGALSSGSIASGFGTIATANTITGTTLNGTTGINTGAGAGTQRIDASGNLVNISSITAGGTITLSGLSTGIVKSNGSGVLSSSAVDLSTADVTGTLPINRGGTNSTATPTAGGIAYGTGTAYAFTTAGTSGQVLQSNGGGAPTWVDSASLGTNYWQRNNGALSPLNTSDDLLVGGTSTASAKFQIFGNTGNATTSGSLTFNTGGTIQTTNAQSLNLGSASTGTINLISGGTTALTAMANGNVGIGVVAPINRLGIAGNVAIGSYAGVNFAPTNGLIVSGNVGIGTPSPTAQLDVAGNASVAGALTFRSGAGAIQTTANNTLTLGGNTTGNIVFSPLNGAGTVTVNGAMNLASGNAYQINGTNVLTSNTLGSGVTTSSLTTVGALSSGSITSGFGTIATGNTITGTTLNGTTGINTGAGAGTQRIDASGNLANIGTINASGALTFGNYTTSGGLLYTNGTGAVAQTATGSTGQCLTSSGGGAPTWSTCSAGAQLWQRNAGAVAPINITDDLLLGGISTASAKFAFLNNANGTPVASISANSGNNALYLTGDGTLGTTNAQTLTIGSLSTGDITIGNTAAGSLTLGTAMTTGAITIGGTGAQTGTLSLGIGTGSQTINLGTGGTGSKTINLGTGAAANVLTLGTTNTTASTTLLSGSGNITLGNNTGNGNVVVNPNAGGNAALIINKQGALGDLFTASQAGTTKFTVTNTGNILSTGIFQVNGLAATSYNRIGAGTSAFGLNSANDLYISGKLEVSGGLYAPSSGVSGYWQRNAGALSPTNITDDLLVGGTASTSAVFKVSPNGTSPVASIAGQTSYAGMVVDQAGLGDIFTASKSGATKFVVANSGNVGIGTANPGALLDLSGDSQTLRFQQTNLAASAVSQIALTTTGTAIAGNQQSILFQDNGTTQAKIDYRAQDQLRIGTSANLPLRFFTNGANNFRLSVTETGNIGMGTINPISELHVTRSLANGANGKALAVFDQIENQDILTASAGGVTKFTIKNSGAVVIGDATNGLTFDPVNGGPLYTGTARPTKTITLSPEYAGAILTASGSANTNGFMTSDASPSATPSTYNFENYYQWSSSQTTLQDYTVAVKVTMPADFSAWKSSGTALSVDLYTNLNGTGSNKVDIVGYKASNGSIVVLDQGQVSATNKNWTTRNYTAAQLQSLNAGDMLVLYLKMYSKDNNDVMIGDIDLTYLSKF